MHRLKDGDYRHKNHTVRLLPNPMSGADGTYHWLVRPDGSQGSWIAQSLDDARELINISVDNAREVN